MKKAFRIFLALYLGYCILANLHALALWMKNPSLSAYALCFLCFVWLAGAVLLFLSPSAGRWVVVLGQIPQMICLAAPSFYFSIFTGIVAAAGFSILPDGDHWVWRPEFMFHGSQTIVGLAFGYSEERGFAVVLNFGALLIALIAFYGLREGRSSPHSQLRGADAPLRG